MREKYVKVYFVLSSLLVSDFLLFNVLSWSSIKKFKVLGSQILESWILGPESLVLSTRSQVLGPKSWVLGPGCMVLGLTSWVLGPGSWVLGPESWVVGSRSQVLGPVFQVLGAGSWVLGPETRVLGPRFWVLGLGYWVLGHKCWVIDPESRVLGLGSWVLGLYFRLYLDWDEEKINNLRRLNIFICFYAVEVMKTEDVIIRLTIKTTLVCSILCKLSHRH